MVAGKAIVATRTGQVAEVIQHGENGILVNPGDVGAFSDTITLLLKDQLNRQRLGRNARRQAVEQHSWERYAQQLEEIYYGLL